MAANYDNDTETMTITCDVDGYEQEYEGSWQSCIEQAKMDGWRIRKVGGEWTHVDKDCVDLQK